MMDHARSSILKFHPISKGNRDRTVQILMSELKEDEKIAQVAAELPFIDITDMLTNPLSAAGASREVLPAIEAVVGSIDLTHQFTDDGVPQGHSQASTTINPTFFQRRRSGHPLVGSLIVVTMLLSARGCLNQTLRGSIETMILALQDIEECYRNARFGSTLPVSLRAAAKEGHNLLNEDFECTAAPALATLASTPIVRSKDIYAVTQRYSNLNSSTDLPQNVPQDVLQVIDLLDINRIIPRNEQGIPVFWFPTDSPTSSICKLAYVSWQRAVTDCDRTEGDDCERMRQWWTPLIVWTRHYIEFGDQDPITGLRFDFSGASYSPLAPTLLAHNIHRRSLSTTTTASMETGGNAMVQRQAANFFIKRDRISTILSWLRSSQGAVVALLERMGSVGLLEGWEEGIESLQGMGSWNQTWVAVLKHNGRDIYE